MMHYHVGDKFLVGDVEVQVFRVNQGMAWVSPVEGDTHICLARLDEQGFTEHGTKAIPIMNIECMAV